ncbi:hypothetical protein ILYODFUR_031849 [Ilyodon furcidens]|uniref:Uncharacterized protein n=1 Tax=Ilyodon furcidens TaxID=33524 RepID=A0ABV0UA42_9TELE
MRYFITLNETGNVLFGWPDSAGTFRNQTKLLDAAQFIKIHKNTLIQNDFFSLETDKKKLDQKKPGAEICWVTAAGAPPSEQSESLHRVQRCSICDVINKLTNKNMVDPFSSSVQLLEAQLDI